MKTVQPKIFPSAPAGIITSPALQERAGDLSPAEKAELAAMFLAWAFQLVPLPGMDVIQRN